MSATLCRRRVSKAARPSAARPTTPASGLVTVSQPGITLTMVAMLAAGHGIGPVSRLAKGRVMLPPAGMTPPRVQRHCIPDVSCASAGAVDVSVPGMTVPGKPVQRHCATLGAAACRLIK